MLRFLCFSLLLTLFFSVPHAAQQKLDVNRLRVCSYDGSTFRDEMYSFAPDEGTKDLVSRIMKYTGLPQNFEVRAANVPNASAVIEGGDHRLLLYNQSFFDEITTKTHTQWAAVSVMAHEIGHHLSGHTLSELGGKRADKELEADQFSGHVLFQMGAAVDLARRAIETLSDAPTPNYPPKSARLAAVTSGWKAAEEERGVRTSTIQNAAKDSSQEADTAAAPSKKKRVQKPAETTNDEDTGPDPSKAPKVHYGRHCYDAWGNARCVLAVPGVIGASCFCPYQGWGWIGQ